MTTPLAQPPVVPYDDWLSARKELLVQEKALTKQRDAINATRRRLPMVRLEKDYVFDGLSGRQSLMDLFEDKRQLIVYHFMFAPEWDEGCPGCTGYVNEIGDLSFLGKRDTRFVLVSRAPLAKLEAYKQEKGWVIPWYSSLGSDFNYDFHVSFDKSIAPIEYNYKTQAELEAQGESGDLSGESQGMSVFFRGDDGTLYHTYSAYARGVESLTDAYNLLDLTPYGRQENFEDSPAGWPQHPTYG